MLLEIHGVNFNNKGAVKMMDVVTEKLSSSIPDLQFIVDPSHGTPEERKTRGFITYGSRRFWMSKPEVLYSVMTAIQAVRLSRSSKTLSDLDGFVDISGFAFSSQWGDLPTINIARLTERLRRDGKKIVFLPQAFGPFISPRIRDAMSRIINNADLIFARDNVSYENLAELVDAPAANIKVAPDITLFQGVDRVPISSRDRTVVIVPNTRLLDQGKKIWSSESYRQALSEVVKYCHRSGFKALFMLHDTQGGDKEIFESIRREMPNYDIQVSTASDPWDVKRIIGQSTLLVGSRFHALAAALSAGVPAIAIGWSHKYGELLTSFGLGEYNIDRAVSGQELVLMMDRVLEPSSYPRVVGIVEKALEPMIERNSAMWAEVIRLFVGD